MIQIAGLYSTVQVCDATMMPLLQMPGTKKTPQLWSAFLYPDLLKTSLVSSADFYQLHQGILPCTGSDHRV